MMQEEKTGSLIGKQYDQEEDGFKQPLSAEHKEKIGLLSDLETIRQSRYTPYNESLQKALVNTTAENLDTPLTKPNRLYVITHISATNETRTGTRTELYYVIGEQEFAVNRDVQSAAAVSVDFGGQIIIGEGTKIRAKFVGGTAADVLKLTVSGYWIKP